jgi:hypothetical protein
MDLRVGTPCPKKWDDLTGNDRVRYCGDCRLNVYNFADMKKAEIERVVRETEGRLCGSLYLRGDRTAAPADCPTQQIRHALRRWITGAVVLLAIVLTWVSRNADRPCPTGLPKWVQATLDIVDPRPVRRKVPRLLGDIIVIPAPFPPKPRL